MPTSILEKIVFWTEDGKESITIDYALYLLGREVFMEAIARQRKGWIPAKNAEESLPGYVRFVWRKA